jgi:hypothetical protein
MVKEIIITNKKKVVTKVLVDDEDHLWLSKYSWHIKKPDKNAKGGSISTTYIENGIEVHGTMHIMIMKEKTKDISPEDYVVTHKDKNYLNNTRENLEYNSRSASNQGKDKKEGTTSKYKGVSFYKDREKFIAKHSRKHLGTYETEEEAAKVYDLNVLKTYGKDIQTNGFITWNDLSDETKKEITENIENSKTKVLTKLDKLNLLSEEIQKKLTPEAKNKKITYNSVNQAIIITHKKQEIIVDADKWHELSVKPWRINSGGYAITDTKSSTIDMHNYLMNNSDKNSKVDHINKNKKDNRMENLRFATSSQNSHNRKKSENASSNYNGVSKNGDKYNVAIKKDGKNYSCGTYSDEKLAALAYNIKASELYDNYSNLNELPEDFVAANIDDLTKKLKESQELKEKNKNNLPGISYRKDNNCWRIQITHDKKPYDRSGFSTKEEAIEGYNKLLNELISKIEDIPGNMNKIKQLKKKIITI